MSKGNRTAVILVSILDLYCFLMFLGAKAWGNEKDLIFWGVLTLLDNLAIWGMLS